MRLMVVVILIVVGLASSALAECTRGLLDLPPRGLSCLHCMHPNAPGGSGPITELLRASCLKRPMLAFVVDGSFGWNEAEAKSAISALSEGGRVPWIHLYVYNGAAQRRWDSGVFQSFAEMHPATFLRRLKTDPGYQAVFREVVRERLLPLVDYALARGARVSVAPGLEDTLDAEGFAIALNLTRSELRDRDRIEWIRSSCYQCGGYEAQATPRGVQQEIHTSDSSYPLQRGILHTDGEYFRFATERDSEYPILNSYRALLKSAERARSGFLLWVWKYQDAPPGLVPRSPNEREYRGPTDSEHKELVRFFRTPSQAARARSSRTLLGGNARNRTFGLASARTKPVV